MIAPVTISMRKIVYPGTFDPITNGHVSMIERASRMFDHIVIAIADNHKKQPLFSLTERQKLAKAVTSSLDQHCTVEVEVFSGLLGDVLQRHACHMVLRGLRTAQDFDYEIQMSHINHKLNHAMETVCLMAREPHTCISSSWVKELAKLGAKLECFVPPMVAQALAAKFTTPGVSSVHEQ